MNDNKIFKWLFAIAACWVLFNRLALDGSTSSRDPRQDAKNAYGVLANVVEEDSLVDKSKLTRADLVKLQKLTVYFNMVGHKPDKELTEDMASFFDDLGTDFSTKQWIEACRKASEEL